MRLENRKRSQRGEREEEAHLIGRRPAVLVEDNHDGGPGDELGVAQLRVQKALEPRVGKRSARVVAVVALEHRGQTAFDKIL